ncbi:uncharacterized protein LOC121611854 isoform X2 [Chelmon rostratus]|uniref:uncharacterized protein LOC121611854 isoform X2 n=1 Tax=Chelmon rostratus TaxID=109905 RepID=UPI001BE8EA8B|nr:uncharacterized protein LOC121611854 isoform X2 [Chelmon rostratus]
MLILFYSLLMLGIGRCTDQIFETKTAVVGSHVKLTCTHKNLGGLFWIRLVSGELPVFLRRSFSSAGVDPHFTAKEEPEGFVLRIKEAQLSDTAVYYCMKIQQDLTFLKGVDLRVKGTEPDTTADPLSDPVTPRDSVSPHHPVLSDPETKTRPREQTVCCVGSGSNQSHPTFTCTPGNSVEEHETNPEGLPEKKCTFSFFKNGSSSDAGTYYFAGTTCEEIFCGNRSKPDNGVNMWDTPLLSVLCAALAISLIVIAYLVYSIKKLKTKSCDCCYAAVALATDAATVDHQSQQVIYIQKRCSRGSYQLVFLSNCVNVVICRLITFLCIFPQTDEDSLVYSAPTFSGRKAKTRDAKLEKEESIYADVRARHHSLNTGSAT